MLQLNNFRTLKSYGWPGFKGQRLWRQDKGQRGCAQAFATAITSGDTSALIPLDELLEVMRATFAAAGVTPPPHRVTMLARLSRVFFTLIHLQPLQALYFVWRRVLGPRAVAHPSSTAGVTLALSGVTWPANRNSSYNEVERSFSFLNRTLALGQDIDWCPQQANRLWRYNLHYFDYLGAANVSAEAKAALIDHWIELNPQGSEPAWEPYTASLRISNWVQYFITLEAAAIDSRWLLSLYEQALWLRKNLELHILANHYFENLRALLFAGCALDVSEAQHWRSFATRELQAQLGEQFLADGGHYERSPQYHAIVLQGCLDLLRLVRLATTTLLASIPDALIAKLRSTVEQGLVFLNDIVDPADQIPLLGDSAYNASPNLTALKAEAVELGLALPNNQTNLIDKPASGIYGYRNQKDWFVIDCGDIGPSYQPGHSHCDFLSYLLTLRGCPIIVDTGVYEYEPGAMRHYVRSTGAHNTISVDGAEQSEIWGEFRSARRARRLHASIERLGDQVVFSGAYTGFPTLKGTFTHQREVRLQLTQVGDIGGLEIEDTLLGNGQHTVTSRLHFHPDLVIEDAGAGVAYVETPTADRWQLHIPEHLDYELEALDVLPRVWNQTTESVSGDAGSERSAVQINLQYAARLSRCFSRLYELGNFFTRFQFSHPQLKRLL